ncbi:MAG: hypothetical protein AABY22_30170 [Nanoarchaeota archaeon]
MAKNKITSNELIAKIALRFGGIPDSYKTEEFKKAIIYLRKVVSRKKNRINKQK